MNIKSMLVAGAATVAGVAGGVAVYQITAPAEVEHEAAPEAVAATPKARAAKGETRYAPCRPPSVLEGGKCVTTAVQTVTLPAPAAAAPAPAAAPQAAAPAAPSPKAAAPAASAPAPAQQPAQQPAHQPAGHPAGGGNVDYEDSDCQKWHEGDADDPEEAQDDYEDCMEDSAEEREDAGEDRRDDAEDARDD